MVESQQPAMQRDPAVASSDPDPRALAHTHFFLTLFTCPTAKKTFYRADFLPGAEERPGAMVPAPPALPIFTAAPPGAPPAGATFLTFFFSS